MKAENKISKDATLFFPQGIQDAYKEYYAYKENIIDHYKHPRNCHELQDFTFQQKELNPLCGDEITLFLKITDNKVQAVSFIGQGCAISQASISLLTDYLKGKTFDIITMWHVLEHIPNLEETIQKIEALLNSNGF